MLIDYHMHLERGEYSFAYLDQMIEAGRERGVEEFGITEHSHHFREFMPCYQSVLRDESVVGHYQEQWLRGKRKFVYSLDEWVDFIQRAKAVGYPVKLGLEVCYFPGEEERMASILARYPWDYITGSVHWLDGWGYDHLPLRAEWHRRGIDRIYVDYLRVLEQSIRSGLFDLIGHPLVIGMFGDQPSFDLEPHYQRLAQVMSENGVCAEINTGMLYRYPAKQMTPPRELLLQLRQHGVPIVLGSDAHQPDEVGTALPQAMQLAKECGYTESVRFAARKRISNPL